MQQDYSNIQSLTLLDLPRDELSRRLNGPGLGLATGPFVFRIRSSSAAVLSSLTALYPDFPVVGSETFADFHVGVRSSGGLRRFVRKQVQFEFDSGLRPFKPLPWGQAFAMLEWGMNWCIYSHAHTFMIIHGAVLERGGAAIILPAPSGSGKSTLCAAMMARGWRLLSDELVLIDPADGHLQPLGRPVSLKNRSIEVMRTFAPDAFISQPIHDTSKGSVAHMRPSAESVRRVGERVLPSWVVFPRYVAEATTRLSSVRKSDVFMSLVENAFNYSLLRERGFIAMSQLVERVSGFRVEYGDLDDVIAAIEQRIGTDR